MNSKVLSSIPGIELYPIVALILFVGFFTGLIVWFVKADKSAMRNHAEMPLDNETKAPLQ